MCDGCVNWTVTTVILLASEGWVMTGPVEGGDKNYGWFS